METQGLLWDGVVFGKTLLVRGQAQRAVAPIVIVCFLYY